MSSADVPDTPNDPVEDEATVEISPSGATAGRSVDDAASAVSSIGTTEDGEPRLGRYVLLKELGRGGQGQVFLARDAELGREVALKVLNGGGAISPSARLRFKGEAEKAARLEHPNIARVHEWGEEAGIPFIAMEFVRGETLAAWIRGTVHDDVGTVVAAPDAGASTVVAGGTTDGGDGESAETHGAATAGRSNSQPSSMAVDRRAMVEVARLIESAARGLHEAHERGLVHRDIKPGNLIVTPDRGLVILDFGLARDESSDAPGLTMTGDVVGTPAYLSPEQLSEGKVPVDRRSDVFSLGVTLFECLALKRPFVAPTLQLLFREIVSREAPDLRRINRRIPADLAVIVAHALAKHPDQRYQTAVDLAEDLRRFREHEPIMARPVGPVTRSWRWAQRKPAVASLLLVLVLAIPTIAALTARHLAVLPQVRKQEAAERERIVEGMIERALAARHYDRQIEAEAELEKALALAPSSAEVVGLLALSKLDHGDAASALSVLDGHRDLEDEVEALSFLRARVLRRLGREPERPGLLESPPVPKGHLGWYLNGMVLLGSMKPGEADVAQDAFDCLLTAALMAPSPRASYHYLMASALDECPGRVDPIVVDRTIRVLTENFGDRALALAYAALICTDDERAAVLLRRAVAIEDNYRERYNLGVRLYRLRRFEEAEAEYRRSIAFNPDHAEAHINLGMVLRLLDRPDDAVAALRRAVELDTASVSSRAVLAAQLAQLGLQAESDEVRKRAAEIEPENADDWYSMGYMRSALRDASGALAAFRRARELGHPAVADILGNTGFFLQILGRDEEAAKDYAEALEIEPGNARALSGLAAALFDLGRYEEAAEAARKWVAVEPGSPRPHDRLGACLSSLGRSEEAIASHLRALEVDPDHVYARINLAVLQRDGGQLEEALASCRAALAVAPDFANAHFQLGHTLLALGRLEEAVAAFREAFERDGRPWTRASFVDATIAHARRLAEEGRRDAALEALRGAAAIAGDDEKLTREIEGLTKD
ncbi:MAG: tetratricopeptide repeat protein [Planctomycetota bacterium]